MRMNAPVKLFAVAGLALGIAIIALAKCSPPPNPGNPAFSLTTVATVDQPIAMAVRGGDDTLYVAGVGGPGPRDPQRRCRPDSRARHLTAHAVPAASRASWASPSRRTEATSTSTTPISTATRTSTSSRWDPMVAPTLRRSDRSCSRSSPSPTTTAASSPSAPTATCTSGSATAAAAAIRRATGRT